METQANRIKGIDRDNRQGNKPRAHQQRPERREFSREKPRSREAAHEFRCTHCREMVSNHAIGTAHRNHCPCCLWSKHVDGPKSGDRRSNCQSSMAPVALTFKQEGYDRYGERKQGELMIVHQCTGCNDYRINRIAGDDNPVIVEEVYRNSLSLEPETLRALESRGITPLTHEDEAEVMRQLNGDQATIETI